MADDKPSLDGVDITEVEVTSGPELANEGVDLSAIDSWTDRVFEDSKRDGELIVVYTESPFRDAAYFSGIVVAYNEKYVVLVEKPHSKHQQQNMVRRAAIIGIRSQYNMLQHSGNDVVDENVVEGDVVAE